MAAFGPVNSAQGAIAIAQNSNKFSGLPDIDTSAVDVYETPSSPELKPIKHTSRNNTSGGAGLRDYDDSEESDDPVDGDASIPGEDEAVAAARRRRRKAQQADDGRGEIDRRGITTEEARIRFQGSTDISAEDTSRRQYARRHHPRRRRASDYYLESDVYELEALSSMCPKETPLAKLRRLRLEAAELEEQLNEEIEAEKKNSAQQPGDLDCEKTSKVIKRSQPSNEAILQQLRSLRLNLNQTISTKQSGYQSATSSADEISSAGAALADVKNPALPANDDATGAGPESMSASASQPPVITSASVHLADIDERLAFLENIVGSNQSVLEETQTLPRPLLPTVARLEHMAALLSQPRHIDAVSKRIKLLVAELDRVYEARRKLSTLPTSSGAGAVVACGGDSLAAASGSETDRIAPLDPITLSKLDEAFALCSRIQPLVPLAPALLQRLRSLSQLHASASDFASTLENVHRSQRDVESHLAEMLQALKDVGESLKENEQRTRGNLEVVKQRMEQLDKRIAALGS